AIEPIRAAYLGQFAFDAVVLKAPYGALTAAQCLLLLLLLSAGLFVSIRPLLSRKLS
ncbi:MAG: ABC transporter permease, partial [Synechococcaceae bacterium WB9_3_282]|nr:ABC transporter permease [Synechococcaceae bacterium WB9_3_282]